MDRPGPQDGEESNFSTNEALHATKESDENNCATTTTASFSENHIGKEDNYPDETLSDASALASLAPKPAAPVLNLSHSKYLATLGGGAGNTKSVAQTKWEQMLKHLLDFKEKHGHCLVPNRYPDNPQLGSWVSTQRRQYKTLQASLDTPMTHERARILEDIGFVWQTRDPRHVPWSKRYEELCEYKKKYGNCLVPIGFKENVQLSNWVSTQRQEYKLMKDGKPSRLTPDRILLLNSVGFIWEAQRGGPRRKRSRREIAQEKWDNLVPSSENGAEVFYSSNARSDYSVPPAGVLSPPAAVLSSSDPRHRNQYMNMNGPDIITSEPALKFQRCDESIMNPSLSHHHHPVPSEDAVTLMHAPLHVTCGEQLSRPGNYTSRVVTEELTADSMTKTTGDIYDDIPHPVIGNPNPHPLRVVSVESYDSYGKAVEQDFLSAYDHSTRQEQMYHHTAITQDKNEATASSSVKVEADNDIFADADEDDEHNTIDSYFRAKKGGCTTSVPHKDQNDATIALLSLGAL